MSPGYKIRNQAGIHFLSFSVVEWIDIFTRDTYCYVIVNSLNHCIAEKGLIVYSWVIMSNHLHLIVAASKGDLSDIVRDFKKFTAQKILQFIEDNKAESRRNCLPARSRFGGGKDAMAV
jgi:putative transposase